MGGQTFADWNQEDVDFAAQHLQLQSIDHLVQSNGLLISPSDETIIRILDTNRAVSTTQDMQGYGDNFMYDRPKTSSRSLTIQSMLRMKNSQTCRFRIFPCCTITDLTWPCISKCVEDPSMYADLVCYTFRRSDGQQDEVLDDETRKTLAHSVFECFWNLQEFPGNAGDGSVDSEAV